MRDLMVVVAMCAFLPLTGCSAFIASSGTKEWDIIHPGDTKTDLSKRLGEPLDLKVFDQPILIVDAVVNEDNDIKNNIIIKRKHGIYWLDRDTEAHSPDEVTEKAYYRFNERLSDPRVEREMPQFVLLDVATLGLAELFLTPTVLVLPKLDPSQPNGLIVWFEKSGRARAYRLIRIEDPSQ